MMKYLPFFFLLFFSFLILGTTNSFATSPDLSITTSPKEKSARNNSAASRDLVREKRSMTYQECSAFNIDEKSYLYGEGIFKNFGEKVDLPHTQNKREEPRWYGGELELIGTGSVIASIPGKWINPTAPLQQLQLAPLPHSIQPGVLYTFCFRKIDIKKSDQTYIIIDHPQTIIEK